MKQLCTILFYVFRNFVSHKERNPATLSSPGPSGWWTERIQGPYDDVLGRDARKKTHVHWGPKSVEEN